jgi:hypothetical protein
VATSAVLADVDHRIASLTDRTFGMTDHQPMVVAAPVAHQGISDALRTAFRQPAAVADRDFANLLALIR